MRRESFRRYKLGCINKSRSNMFINICCYILLRNMGRTNCILFLYMGIKRQVAISVYQEI